MVDKKIHEIIRWNTTGALANYISVLRITPDMWNR
jgi:hypothetical protein